MKQNLENIFNEFREKGYRIIAPTRCDDKVFFKEVTSFDEITLDYVNSVFSVKEWFFPRTEIVMEFEKKDVRNPKIKDVPNPGQKTAIIGIRPCDEKAIAILDKVFSWDYKDNFYLQRRKNIELATVDCEKLGQNCFCHEFDAWPDTQKIKRWLDENFESDFWGEISAKCLGCGVCTFVCPTCHCFDVVDEASLEKGVRRKNWDSCSFSNFTLHASGHNPRPTQAMRLRNRIMHKFKYYKDKFDQTACVGCGRCARVCPVSMNLKSILDKILNYNK